MDRRLKRVLIFALLIVVVFAATFVLRSKKKLRMIEMANSAFLRLDFEPVLEHYYCLNNTFPRDMDSFLAFSFDLEKNCHKDFYNKEELESIKKHIGMVHYNDEFIIYNYGLDGKDNRFKHSESKKRTFFELMFYEGDLEIYSLSLQDIIININMVKLYGDNCEITDSEKIKYVSEISITIARNVHGVLKEKGGFNNSKILSTGNFQDDLKKIILSLSYKHGYTDAAVLFENINEDDVILEVEKQTYLEFENHFEYLKANEIKQVVLTLNLLAYLIDNSSLN